MQPKHSCDSKGMIQADRISTTVRVTPFICVGGAMTNIHLRGLVKRSKNAEHWCYTTFHIATCVCVSDGGDSVIEQ